jgi:hypothetical protein
MYLPTSVPDSLKWRHHTHAAARAHIDTHNPPQQQNISACLSNISFPPQISCTGSTPGTYPHVHTCTHMHTHTHAHTPGTCPHRHTSTHTSTHTHMHTHTPGQTGHASASPPQPGTACHGPFGSQGLQWTCANGCFLSKTNCALGAQNTSQPETAC